MKKLLAFFAAFGIACAALPPECAQQEPTGGWNSGVGYELTYFRGFECFYKGKTMERLYADYKKGKIGIGDAPLRKLLKNKLPENMPLSYQGAIANDRIEIVYERGGDNFITIGAHRNAYSQEYSFWQTEEGAHFALFSWPLPTNCRRSFTEGETDHSYYLSYSCFYPNRTLEQVYQDYKSGKLGRVYQSWKDAWKEKLEVGKDITYNVKISDDEYYNTLELSYKWNGADQFTIEMGIETTWSYSFRRKDNGVEVDFWACRDC
ncbi:MAG: hypothetical protein LBQ52_01585 [Helicobacteraceae bacterium]|jgi:hypothetical protein|nr:hypothetical protein [Helicobacteraceae bacterium]